MTAAGLPHAFVGVVIALLVLLPETLAAVRNARRRRMQTSLNLAYGSAMASIGLTIPAIGLASIWLDGRLLLGLGPTEMVLLGLTVVVSVLTVVPGRATLLQAGLLPTFYQFTEALIEVKLSVTLKETSTTETSGRPGFTKRSVMAFAAPVNFRNASTYSHTAEGSSLLRVTMKPVPAPVRLAPDVVTVNATVNPPVVTRTER